MDATQEASGGIVNGAPYRLIELLGAGDRDFLVKKNGDQVNLSHLEGKIVGLYFSASWCGPCHRFTPVLANVYEELASKGDFEVVFISSDHNQESFEKYFSEMPWLAIPFSDSETRSALDERFEVSGIPHLVILDAKGNVATDDAVTFVREYGANAYPFTKERVQELKEEEEVARKNQSLKSILVHDSRDFLVYNDGKKISVSELEGKTVGLLFSVNSYPPCKEFITRLIEVYNKLKGENFEIVLISLDTDSDSFNEGFKTLPWPALPCNDKACTKLPRYFEIQGLPMLAVIGPDGKTLHSDASELIEEHGSRAYPFTAERLAELAEIQKAKLEAQTLESLLVSDDKDFVIGNGGGKVPVTDLVGKTVLLYFSAHWCPPCRGFTPKLIETYHQIKAKDPSFEIVFISSDHDEASFEDYFGSMPYLALPFGDARKALLSRTFKVRGIPTLVAIGPSGKTITTDARDMVATHGASAYPFTEERLKQLEKEVEEEAKQWPTEVSHALHTEHPLILSRRRVYVCDACNEEGQGWSYLCRECDFDLHPKCALEAPKDEQGWVCDGETCRRA